MIQKEGRYIYCVIASSQERSFGPMGIGERGDDVSTIGYNDLSMVVSSYPIAKLTVNSENMLKHERVIEAVMKEFDGVLPVRFGTIASNADEVRNLLSRRYREFKSALRDMDHKVELGVKGLWKNMPVIFKEIVDENKAIKSMKESIQKSKNKKNIEAKMEAGKLVEKALEKKKAKEAEKIVEAFRRTSFDYRLNKTIGDEMFVNASFLVDKGREKEFDNIMGDLGEEYKRKVKFMYTGPLPVFNFVNIVIYPEEWEK